jgi:hypothetical protein
VFAYEHQYVLIVPLKHEKREIAGVVHSLAAIFSTTDMKHPPFLDSTGMASLGILPVRR